MLLLRRETRAHIGQDKLKIASRSGPVPKNKCSFVCTTVVKIAALLLKTCWVAKSAVFKVYVMDATAQHVNPSPMKKAGYLSTIFFW